MRESAHRRVVDCALTMNISTSASVVIPKSREEVFAHACANETVERTLRPLGPIAGLTKVEMFEGHVPEKGAWRRISMTDGSVLEDLILDYDPAFWNCNGLPAWFPAIHVGK